MKCFSLLPLRRGFQPHYVRINTDVLNNWMGEHPASWTYRNCDEDGLFDTPKQKGKRRKPNEEQKTKQNLLLWNAYFNIGYLRKKSRQRFEFDQSITTDGISVSVQFKTKGSTKRRKTHKQRKYNRMRSIIHHYRARRS